MKRVCQIPAESRGFSGFLPQRIDSSCIVGLGSRGQTSGQQENNIYVGLLDNRAVTGTTDKVLQLVTHIF